MIPAVKVPHACLCLHINSHLQQLSALCSWYGNTEIWAESTPLGVEWRRLVLLLLTLLGSSLREALEVKVFLVSAHRNQGRSLLFMEPTGRISSHSRGGGVGWGHSLFSHKRGKCMACQGPEVSATIRTPPLTSTKVLSHPARGHIQELPGLEKPLRWKQIYLLRFSSFTMLMVLYLPTRLSILLNLFNF